MALSCSVIYEFLNSLVSVVCCVEGLENQWLQDAAVEKIYTCVWRLSVGRVLVRLP